MELYEVMRTTPATRAFRETPVPDSVLYRMLDHARFAPSGGNRQGWRVVVVKDPALRRRVRDLYQLGWRECVAHASKGLIPFAPREHGRWPAPAVNLERARETPAPNPFADHLDVVPVLLLLCVDLGVLACVDNGLDRQSIVGGASIYPFGHNLLLAARNEGLGGVMTSVLARQEPAVRELIELPDGYALAALIALGYPQREIAKLSRRPVEEFTTIDRFGGPGFTVGS
ncbi:MAG: nitroreductase family protein [Egibacteraceae bacterium]